MADLRKQVDEGQDKWRQGVNLTSITDVNDYIKFKILEYRYFKFMNRSADGLVHATGSCTIFLP